MPSFLYNHTQKKLTVRGVTAFPDEVFLYPDVEILDMSDNQMTELPDRLAELKHLRVAFLSSNAFRKVPAALVGCERLELVGLKSCGIETFDDHVLPVNLKGLILTDNQITTLPDSIVNYTQLQKLMLTGNLLKSLPVAMSLLTRLELLRVAGNKLEAVPTWLPSLPSLSWYADSDNVFNNDIPVKNTSTIEFNWNEISFGEKIGESSKNVVYAAQLKDGQNVAVKLFGVGTTTDGSADNETLAALVAGDHLRIVGVLGTIAGAPNGQQGLVMQLVPKEYVPLGYPPDFVRYTRDVYKNDARFDESTVVAIVTNIAAALCHLHSRGIMHGDVYAHNVLYAPNGDAMLCDFGAASLYDRNSPHEVWREKLDVAGYGHLVEELVLRIDQAGPRDGSFEVLSELYKACIYENAAERPIFSEIQKRLQTVHLNNISKSQKGDC